MEPELKTILETMQGQLTSMQGQMQKMERENAAAHVETRRHIEVVLEAFVKPKFAELVETIQILDESLSERIRVLEERP